MTTNFGNFLMMESEDKGTYIQEAQALKDAMDKALKMFTEFQKGNIDEEALEKQLRDANLWFGEAFKPHQTGFCRLVRNWAQRNCHSSTYQELRVPGGTLHSGNELFPVKSYTETDPEEAYRVASQDGVLWKDAYGRSRLRAFASFLEGVRADILNPERKAAADEPDEPAEADAAATEDDNG